MTFRGAVGAALLLLTALVLARLAASGTNSPFYTRCSSLRTFVPAVAADSSDCTVAPGSSGGSGMGVPIWVYSNSDANFYLSGTPEAVARFVQKLKTAFEQAGSATGTKVVTESETKQAGLGLMGFSLGFTTGTTHGNITAATKPWKPGQYQLEASMRERGW